MLQTPNSEPKYTDWASRTPDPKIGLCKCKSCKSVNVVLFRRIVTEREGEMHKEYKVVCQHCGAHTGTHWSKNIAQHEWNNYQEGGNL